MNLSSIIFKCHKINPNGNGSHIDSSDCIKNKKTATNPINKNDSKCFQYAVAVALNHEEIGIHSERITKIKPFVNKYNWKGIDFPPEENYWKTFEKSSVTIAYNDFYAEKVKIYPTYVSIHN